MTEPKISLIVCAYNEENNIRECLECAIKNSNGKFFEIIVVNNASTDNTAHIAGSVPGVRVVTETSKGLTMARECGRKAAQGDILVYIDADTHMPPRWLETVSKEFAQDERVVCVSGPYRFFDLSTFQNIQVWIYWNIFARIMYAIVRYMVVGGNFAIRKETLQKMGGFDTTIAFYGEDTNIARRAHQFGKVSFNFNLVMPTSGRRFHGNGFVPTAWTYTVNFFSEAFLKRPATKVYNDLR